MKTYLPPPFISPFEYQGCKQINDPVTRKRLYLTPDGERLPSVTTILSSTKDMTHLNEWRKRVGVERAQQITTEAASRGTSMHANLERFLIGEPRQIGGNAVHIKANAMADVIIENGLTGLSEVWAIEQSLYYPEIFSGTTDLVAVYDGEPSICDFKQTNRPKRLEYVEDYFIQLMFYATAHNKVYGTNIRQGLIFMCSSGDDPIKVGGEVYQQFSLDKTNWNEYEDKMWSKIEQYYKLTT